MELHRATREELLQLIAEQSRVIAKLRARIATLEGAPPKQGEDSQEDSAPAWVKPNRPKREKQPRRKRARGYGRKRSKAMRQVRHAVETCGQCGCKLRGDP